MCHVLFVPGGQTFLAHRRGGGQTFLTHRREGGQTFFTQRGGQAFVVGGGGGYEDVDEEIDVSEASFLVIQASKLSAGARILVAHNCLPPPMP